MARAAVRWRERYSVCLRVESPQGCSKHLVVLQASNVSPQYTAHEMVGRPRRIEYNDATDEMTALRYIQRFPGGLRMVTRASYPCALFTVCVKKTFARGDSLVA